MISKPSSLALLGMASLCILILAACNSGPRLQFVTVTPGTGTIYVSAPHAGAVKAAGRSAARPVLAGKRRAAITPRDITTASCGSLQFAATAFFSDGTSQAETTGVTWTSSSTSVATVDNTGLATGVGLGNANINASFNGISAATPAALEVDQLNTISMSPPSANIPNGTSQQFMAMGNFTLASGSPATQDISSQVTWASSNMNVATVDQTGNATGVAQGTATITATSCDGITVGSATLTVGPAIPTSLQISPGTPTIATGTTVVFTAMELLSDGKTTQPASNPITWQSSTTATATIDPNSGLALGVAASSTTVTITATEAVTGFTGTTTLTVQAAATTFAYLGDIVGPSGNGAISGYQVSAGALTPLTPETAGSGQVLQVLLHPSGDLLFYINGSGGVASFFVDSTTGALTATSQKPTPVGPATAVKSIGVIDPLGRFLYVATTTASTATDNIVGFTITQPLQPLKQGPSGKLTNPTTAGALTPIPGFTPSAPYHDATLNMPVWLMIDSTGTYLYVVNNGGSTISQYSINPTTGVLTPLSAPTVPTGTGPAFGSIDVNGHLFVATSSTTTQSVSAYSITASGATAGQLVHIGDTTITGAVSAINVQASPNGNFLYVVDVGPVSPPANQNGQVFAFNLNSSTGVIGSQIGLPQPTGENPDGIAIDPTGTLLAVDSAGLNPPPPIGAISLYTITASGASAGGLTPTAPPSVNADVSAQFVTFYNAAPGQ